MYKTPKNNFLPRFGAAYQLNDKTVIRGGFGLFAGFLGERRGDVIQPGYTRTTTLGTTTLASGAPIANSRTPAQIANNTLLTAMVANPFAGLPEFAGTNFSNATIARSQLLRPYPTYGDILTTNNDGKSWYDSGQFSIQKRFSDGYTLQASYTFSKWLTANEYLNAGDPTPTKMISDQDSPHRFSLSGIYALPFGKGKQFLSGANGLVDRIVNGFQLQGVYTFQVGFPIAFGAYNATTAATSGDIFYNGGDISIDSKNRTTDRWFNTDVFSLVTPASHLRTLPFRFTDVRRDNINNFDFSLLKDIRIREDMKIQIRFELINALNEPYFPAPSTTATNFGRIVVSNQDNYARRAQFGIKFLF